MWPDVVNRIVTITCLFVSVASATVTLFIHFQVCGRALLGWLWQGPPNVRRWPMLRSQAARPECVWPGWKVPFRPTAASLLLLLLLLPSTTESHSEGRQEEEEEDGLKKKAPVWSLSISSDVQIIRLHVYIHIWHIIWNLCEHCVLFWVA